MGRRMATKLMLSPLTGKLAVYSKTQQLLTTDRFQMDMNLLKDQFNGAFLEQRVDAQVEECRMIQTFNQSNVIIDTWVAGESPILPAVAWAVIAVVIIVVAAYVIILAATAVFIERLWPKPTYYAPAKTGETTEKFHDYASYLTYMQNVYNPQFGKPYSCPYCGQGFATEAEMLEHMEYCPWKEGPPDRDEWPWWMTALLIGGGVLGLIIIVPKVLDALAPRG